jgi:Spy/CpxP family protein refolding chaperone
MKAKILKMAMALFISGIMISQLNAQMGRMRMLDSIPGITKEQKIKIATIQATQRIEMQELREKRNAATAWDEKDKLDRQILEKKIEFRNSMRNVLNDEQKKYFDQNFQKRMENRMGKGQRNGKECRKGNRGECKKSCPNK